jgi:membrane fusion protein (multidrug efflux system)
VDIVKKHLKMSLYYWGGISLLLLMALLYYLIFWSDKAYTDDAYVEGNQVVITPLRDGFITGIYTDDTFLVQKGQLIVQLDDTDAKLRFDAAKEHLANTVRRVCEMFHQVFVYRSEIAVASAKLLKATQDLQHRRDVLNQGGVSLEDFQHAQAAYRVDLNSLKMVKSLYQKSLSLVQGTSIRNHPLVMKAADAFIQAWVNLYRCKIYAPVDGLVAQRRGQVGMHFLRGSPLMNVIPLDQIWVNANFKETQMKKMRIDQTVTITADFYGRETVYHGTIVGLPGGAGNAFSLLPPQNLSGNWIKIVQRLPVRVALIPSELKEHPLRIGLSVKATAHMKDQTGLRVPTTTAGSPTYETPIFQLETEGSLTQVEKIFEENLDTTLLPFAHAVTI